MRNEIHAPADRFSRRRLLALAGGATAAATLGPASIAARQATEATPESAPPLTTAIIVSATNDPLRVAGSDGMDHLEYDLIVTNAFPEPVTITLIEFLGADGQMLQQV